MTEHEEMADAYREQRSRILHGLADGLRPTPLIICDLPGYQSPVTGNWVEGRVQRREDLKISGCREYDPGMKDDARRNNQENNDALDRSINEGVERMYNQLSDTKRKQLDREMSGNFESHIVRRDSSGR